MTREFSSSVKRPQQFAILRDLGQMTSQFSQNDPQSSAIRNSGKPVTKAGACATPETCWRRKYGCGALLYFTNPQNGPVEHLSLRNAALNQCFITLAV